MPRTQFNDGQVRDPEFVLQPELDAMTQKSSVYRSQVYGRVTVPAGQNYVALTGTSKPSGVIASGASSIGTICTKLAGAIGSHSLTVSSGNTNLCLVRRFSNQEEVFAGGARVYALLQVGVSAVDGSAFADSGANQAQLSFVYLDPSTATLAACPVAAIASQDIEFLTASRGQELLKPESSHAFIPFIDDDIFGRAYAYEESAAESTSSGTSYITKVTLSVSILKAGTYRVGWHYFCRVSNNANPFYTRIFHNATTQYDEAVFILSNTNTTQRYPMAGAVNLNLTSGTHTFNLQYRSGAANKYLYISNAKLEFWRVA